MADLSILSIISKVCTKCGIDKLRSEYDHHPNTERGHTHCKKCRQQAIKSWRKSNPEKAESSRLARTKRHVDDNILYPFSEKSCSTCKQSLPVSDFGRASGQKYNLESRCKSCMRIRHKKWREKNECFARRRSYEYHIKRVYGLTPQCFEIMWVSQAGKCAICRCVMIKEGGIKGKKYRVCIDHNHATGKVRGLLCDDCNKGLGHFRDNEVFLEAALKYMREKN